MLKNHYDLYDFLGYILPGLLLLGTIVFILQRYFNISAIGFLSNSTVIESGVFVVSSFIVGHLIQGFCNPIEKMIYKKKWNGYPSSKFLEESNKHFSKEYKQKLKEKLYNHFGLSEKSSYQELFDSAYCFLLQKKYRGKVERFLSMHGFYRSLMMTCLILFLFFLILLIFKVYSIEVFIFTIIFLISTSIFYKRFIRFSVRFADTVYKEFFVYK